MRQLETTQADNDQGPCSLSRITAVRAIIAAAMGVWPEYKVQVDAPTGPVKWGAWCQRFR